MANLAALAAQIPQGYHYYHVFPTSLVRRSARELVLAFGLAGAIRLVRRRVDYNRLVLPGMLAAVAAGTIAAVPRPPGTIIEQVISGGTEMYARSFYRRLLRLLLATSFLVNLDSWPGWRYDPQVGY